MHHKSYQRQVTYHVQRTLPFSQGKKTFTQLRWWNIEQNVKQFLPSQAGFDRTQPTWIHILQGPHVHVWLRPERNLVLGRAGQNSGSCWSICINYPSNRRLTYQLISTIIRQHCVTSYSQNKTRPKLDAARSNTHLPRQLESKGSVIHIIWTQHVKVVSFIWI